MSHTQKLLVANRGEIAIRIAQAARELGMESVAIYAEDDAACLHTQRTDRAVPLAGSGPAAYLDVTQIVELAHTEGCTLVHPGYGFLSERADFARACQAAGLGFVGPDADTLATLGDKSRARALAVRCGVPVIPGTGGPNSLEQLAEFMQQAPGEAIVVKARAGGGGRGMRVVREASALAEAYARCQSEARAAFGDDALYAERLWAPVRHVEVQVVGDGSGGVSHLWERECSLQRRHQKLVELAPAPGLDPTTRAALLEAACGLAREIDYRGLCTFEFLLRASDWAFIEANPRLQVEHTVTEAITGVDLVQTQLQLACGASLASLGLDTPPEARGAAVQVRVNLERIDAHGEARPGGGTVLTRFSPPGGPGVRVDSHAYPGYAPGGLYDGLLAKVVAHAPRGDMPAALARARRALAELSVEGVGTNRSFLIALLEHPEVLAGRTTTDFIGRHAAALVATAEAQEAQAVVGSGPAAAGSQHDDTVAGQHAAPQDLPHGYLGVHAQMQGSVVSCDVVVGQAVAAQQGLLVMQAMKMQHVVAAPAAGHVRELRVSGGEVVPEGHCLVVIELGDVDVSAGEASRAHDLEHIRPDLEEVIKRHAYGLDAQRPDAVAKRRKTGHRTARENLADLVDEGSFLEYGALAVAAQRKRRTLQELIERTPADGMLAGVGRVNGALFDDGRARCAVVAYDYTVLAGTQGAHNHVKNDRLFEVARRARLPVVFFTEGGGGRPGDVDKASVSALDTTSFGAFAGLSGLVPLVGITTGRCFAGNAAFLGCCDVIIATEDSNIGMGGPAMIEGGGLGVYRPEEIGPLDVQTRNGVVDVVVADEAAAVTAAKQYLSYFQGAVTHYEEVDQRHLRHAVPEQRLRVYDMPALIETLADVDSALFLRSAFAPGMITALIRVEGRPLGVLANDTRYQAGAIDSDCADKASRFMQLCDAFDIPILSLCDCPGFMVGPESEKTAAVRHTSRMYVTASSLSVPFFTIVTRKAYGLGAMAMMGGSLRSPFFIVGWPTSEFGPMGLEGAVRLGFRRELEAIEDPAAREETFDKMVAMAYEIGKGLNVASVFEVDDIIDPKDSRHWIANAMRSAPPAPAREGKKRPFVDTW